MRENLKYKFTGFVALLVGVFTIVYSARRCSESATKIGSDIAVNTVQTIKANREIELLSNRVENLEQYIASIEYKLQKIDSLQHENFRTTPNKSIRKSYSEVTKRYAN